MAKFSRSRSSSRSSGSRSGGFTNSRTGTRVSAARAHQHVGQSFGGYTKTYNPSTGRFSMKRSK